MNIERCTDVFLFCLCTLTYMLLLLTVPCPHLG